MALQFAHGAIQWLSTDAINTVYTVSGLSFQPKALRFYWNGLQNAADAVSGATESRRGVGFSNGTTHRCVTTFDDDGAATSVCASAALSDCVAATITTATIDGKLGTCTITSDGFTVESDDVPPVSVTVFWEAWGDADITNVTIATISEPAATGDVDYSATGFSAGATDQVIMLAGVQSTAAVGSAAAENSGLSIGFAGGNSATGGVVVYGGQDHGSGTADTDGFCENDACLVKGALAGGDINARCRLTSEAAPYGTDTFRLGWTNRAVTNRRSIYMAIKGGSWHIGEVTIAGNSLSATTSVSSLLFTPKGGCLIGRMSAEQTGIVSAVQDRIGVGTFSSTSSRRSMGHLSEDASTSGSSVMEVSVAIEYDQCLCYTGGADTTITKYDISVMAADGFTIINELAGGVASEWIGYMTFGDAPSGHPAHKRMGGVAFAGRVIPSSSGRMW